jgi:hypothetical protein
LEPELKTRTFTIFNISPKNEPMQILELHLTPPTAETRPNESQLTKRKSRQQLAVPALLASSLFGEKTSFCRFSLLELRSNQLDLHRSGHVFIVEDNTAFLLALIEDNMATSWIFASCALRSLRSPFLGRLQVGPRRPMRHLAPFALTTASAAFFTLRPPFASNIFFEQEASSFAIFELNIASAAFFTLRPPFPSNIFFEMEASSCAFSFILKFRASTLFFELRPGRAQSAFFELRPDFNPLFELKTAGVSIADFRPFELDAAFASRLRASNFVFELTSGLAFRAFLELSFVELSTAVLRFEVVFDLGRACLSDEVGSAVCTAHCLGVCNTTNFVPKCRLGHVQPYVCKEGRLIYLSLPALATKSVSQSALLTA